MMRPEKRARGRVGILDLSYMSYIVFIVLGGVGRGQGGCGLGKSERPNGGAGGMDKGRWRVGEGYMVRSSSWEKAEYSTSWRALRTLATF